MGYRRRKLTVHFRTRGERHALLQPKMRTYCLIRSVFVFVIDTGRVEKLRRGTSITLYISENDKGITRGTWGKRQIMVFALDVEENALHTEAWWGSRVI